MTRKDYVLLASAIKPEIEFCKEHKYNDALHHLEALVQKMVYKLELDNPRFDRAKFLTACGIED